MHRLLLAAAFTLAVHGASAHEIKAGDLLIVHPWARATTATQKNGVAYLTELQNHGKTADTLIGVRTDVAASATLHESKADSSGVMTMVPVSGVEIPAGGTVKLGPSGLHIMLMGLTSPLMEETEFPMTLIFAKAGEVPVDVDVAAGNAKAPAEDHDHDHDEAAPKP